MFTLWPSVRVFYDSLFVQNQAVRAPQFSGGENYAALFADAGFHAVVFNTLVYVAVTVPISVFLALVLALVLNRKFRGLGLYRLAFFYPTVLPMVSVATIWLFMYTPDYGLVNVFYAASCRFPARTGWGNPIWHCAALMFLASGSRPATL